MSDLNKKDNDNEFENAELERQEQLARERVGDDKVDQRLEQLANLTMDETMQLKEKAEAVNAEIAETLTLAIDSTEMQAVVQHYLAYTTFALSTLQKKSVLISKDKFNAMANSIANDNDQKVAFDQFGEGLAEHFSKAMQYYAEQNLK
ncbi:TipAS antibiotic-recognition domain-containing protein [Thalassotalea fonticola]|uniref:TipAS antibiotic-recognition domain-containing protein n=1 Tax=Thalassotalea fonticola TaxID=3065649 RepID=A0ABZ0GPA9_9GAMM|nr:TipAS antibiotic-recognition domain-containing protein [Colwelliaceae bacterium S1-1]